MRQIVLQKIINKKDVLDGDEVSTTASNTKPKNALHKDSQDPYDL